MTSFWFRRYHRMDHFRRSCSLGLRWRAGDGFFPDGGVPADGGLAAGVACRVSSRDAAAGTTATDGMGTQSYNDRLLQLCFLIRASFAVVALRQD